MKRLEKRLSQKQLSEQSGVSVPSISNIESGKGDPKINTLQKLATVLDFGIRIKIIDPEDDSGNEVIQYR